MNRSELRALRDFLATAIDLIAGLDAVYVCPFSLPKRALIYHRDRECRTTGYTAGRVMTTIAELDGFAVEPCIRCAREDFDAQPLPGDALSDESRTTG